MRTPLPTAILVFLFVGAGAGCTTRTSPVPPPVVKSSAPSNPVLRGDADNPLVKEARPDTEAVLDDLLAGQSHGDSGLARLSQKVAGYTSWTIVGQEVEPNLHESVKFDGTLKGPSGDARFAVLMVKQRHGRWMIGTFSGPDAK